MKGFIRLEKIGFIFTAIAGTLLHYAFEASGNNFIVGLMAPINESIWEHLKLLFTPYIAFMMFEIFICKELPPCFIPAKAMGVMLGMLSILTMFYTYSGIIGEHILWVDIAIFYISVFIAYFVSCKIALGHPCCKRRHIVIATMLLIIMTAMFAVFTIYPPELNVFYDFAEETYGFIL